MADGPNIGYATLSLIPSLKGADSKLDAIGREAGQRAGGGFAKTFAKVATVGLAAGGVAITAFAAKSASTFSRVGGEVQKLTRFTGLAAEDASRLRFAGEESGVGIDSMTRSLGILSKAVVGTKLDKLKLGLKDAKGNAKPLNDELLIIAKRFQAMPDGVQKTALAMQLFGRSGAELIPFLNKGADGIRELEKQSDRFGQTLSTSDLAAVKASTIAHREFSAAMEGLQIQIGRYVLPIITKFVTVATSSLLPAIHSVADLAYKYLGPAFSAAFDIIGRVGSSVLAFFTQRFLPTLASVIGTIVAIVRPLAEKFVDFFERARKVVDEKLTPAIKARLTPALQKLVDLVKNNLGPVLAGLGGAGLVALAPQIAGIAGSIGSAAVALLEIPNPILLMAAALAALAAGFAYAYQHSARFRDIVQQIATELRSKLHQAVEFVRTSWPRWQADIERVVRVFQEKALPVFEKVATFLKSNLFPILAGIGAAIVASGVASAITGIAAAVATATAAVAEAEGIGAAALAAIGGPITLVVVGLAALTAAGIYAYTHFKPFRDFFKNDVLPVLRDVATFVRDHLQPVLVGLGAALLLIFAPAYLVAAAVVYAYVRFKGFRDVVNNVAKFLVSDVVPAMAQIVEVAGRIAKAIGDKVVPVLKKVLPIIGRVASDFVQWGKDVADKLLPPIEKIGSWIEKHTPIVQALADVVGGVLVVAFTAWAVQAAAAGAATIVAFVASQVQAAISAAAMVIDLALVAAGWVATGVAATASGLAMAAAWLVGLGPIGLVIAAMAAAAVIIALNWDTIKNAAGAAVDFIRDHWRGILEIITGPVGVAAVFVIDHFQGILDFFTGMGSTIASIASTVWEGLKTGLDAVVGWIKERLDSIVSLFVRAVNDAIQLYNDIPGHKDVQKVGASSPQKTRTITPSPSGAAVLQAHSHRFAEGGVISHRSGGILANIGEGRHDEAVLPLGPALAPFAAQIADHLAPQPAATYQHAGSREPRVFQVVLDRKVLAQAVLEDMADQSRDGVNVLKKIGAA